MDGRQISVDAVGTVEAEPEFARVELRAVGEGDAADEARTDAAELAATLRERLVDVPTDRVRTVDMEVRSTETMFEPVSDAAYQATERLDVDCDPDSAESAVVEATDAGAMVQTVRFELHEETRDALEREALTAAMERARERAERLAAPEGLTVAGVRDVTTTEASQGCHSLVDEALEHSHQRNLQPAPVTVSEGVEVVYELAEP